ncbi:MAG: dihydrofolate reductase family protein [Thermoplasmata archaeon]|nr:dihydrofolate reductase family protein [Thermoplasmata archaeon]
MNPLDPLKILFDEPRGRRLPVPRPLSRVYGPLRFPLSSKKPYVLGNFATTLDGVVSLGVPGASGGGEITGFDPHDRLLMGLLRAASDAVVVGAGTLRAVPRHLWTAEHVYPTMAPQFAEFRRRLGKAPTPLNVVVTASGRVDLALPVFSSGKVRVLIVTTHRGAQRLRGAKSLPDVDVAAVGRTGPLRAKAVLRAVALTGRHKIVLVEGGPHLIGDFFGEGALDELFLTLSPQIAGRRDAATRPGMVAGRLFAPEHPLWGSLVGVRRGASALFLRFKFPGRSPASARPRSRE